MTKGLSIHTDKLVTCTSIFHILGRNLEVFGPNPSLQGEVKLAFAMKGAADVPLRSVVTSVTQGMCGSFSGSPVFFSL